MLLYVKSKMHDISVLYDVILAFESGEPRTSGKEVKINGTFKAGISSEHAKKLATLIRDEGPKSVKTQVIGDELRVTSNSRDDLQEVQALVRESDLDFATQFVNYRSGVPQVQRCPAREWRVTPPAISAGRSNAVRRMGRHQRKCRSTCTVRSQ